MERWVTKTLWRHPFHSVARARCWNTFTSKHLTDTGIKNMTSNLTKWTPKAIRLFRPGFQTTEVQTSRSWSIKVATRTANRKASWVLLLAQTPRRSMLSMSASLRSVRKTGVLPSRRYSTYLSEYVATTSDISSPYCVSNKMLILVSQTHCHNAATAVKECERGLQSVAHTFAAPLLVPTLGLGHVAPSSN